ncbi:MAG TPA: MOSC domain-containing protein [Gammaproteobacteria bacterium]|nr:MOSC domain-containing protein [Gammaproteobacteria bacterium]
MARHHATHAELAAGLPDVHKSPRERGSLELIVRRPKSGEREVLEVAELDVEQGLVGDRWALGRRRRVNQLTLINSRLVGLVAKSRDRWALAGDQLYVDFDLSLEHLPPGSRVAVGSAEIEVSPEPHMGCKLFRARYGEDAHKLVNSPDGRAWQLRGINAWVVKGGRVRVGDDVRALFA